MAHLDDNRKVGKKKDHWLLGSNFTYISSRSLETRESRLKRKFGMYVVTRRAHRCRCCFVRYALCLVFVPIILSPCGLDHPFAASVWHGVSDGEDVAYAQPAF